MVAEKSEADQGLTTSPRKSELAREGDTAMFKMVSKLVSVIGVTGAQRSRRLPKDNLAWIEMRLPRHVAQQVHAQQCQVFRRSRA